MTAHRTRAIQRTLWLVLALNLTVTVVKLVVGLTTGALAVIADGLHSIVDSSSNVIGLAGMWIASRPPDRTHPYGHRKYETVAALAIGALLLFASWEILTGLLERLSGGPELTISTQSIVIVALTFPANLIIATYETRRARELRSDLLMADATHTRADLLVTASVLASLVGARLGIVWLDLVVAAAVVVLIVRSAFGILRSTSDVLADSAAIDPAAVEQAVSGVPGLWYVGQVRSRGRADAVYVDLHVRVDANMATNQSHAIASEVERRLKTALPNVVDAVVHVEPGMHGAPSTWQAIATRIRALADGLGVGIHDLHVHAEPEGGHAAEMHLEVDASLNLGQAHALADEFEARVKAALPEIGNLVTHIEPLSVEVADEEGGLGGLSFLRERSREIADEICGPGSCHSVEIHRVDGRLTAVLRCTLPAETAITEAHRLAEEVDRQVRAGLRRVGRVVVHMEPPGAR